MLIVDGNCGNDLDLINMLVSFYLSLTFPYINVNFCFIPVKCNKEVCGIKL